jgi:hypothetical protein
MLLHSRGRVPVMWLPLINLHTQSKHSNFTDAAIHSAKGDVESGNISVNNTHAQGSELGHCMDHNTYMVARQGSALCSAGLNT